MDNKERLIEWAQVAGVGLWLICSVIVIIAAIASNSAYWVPSLAVAAGNGYFAYKFFKARKAKEDAERKK